MLEGEFKEEFGHGKVFCSCGKLLSICGCHTSYGIKIQACRKCLRVQEKKNKLEKRSKNQALTKAFQQGKK